MLFLAVYSCSQNKGTNVNEPVHTIKKPEPLKPVEMVNWVEDQENGLLQQKTIDDLSFSALYKPAQYMSIVELHKMKVDIDSGKFEQVQQSYKGMEYFTYKISTDKTNDELLKYKTSSSDEYYQRLEYYSFKAQNDFYLIAGKDSLPCKLFHFERTFGLTPVLTFVLGFQGERKPAQDLTLVYNDKIFSNGLIKLNFGLESLSSIPAVTIK